MATLKIAIRADAGSSIGIGHVMRCLTLAAELRSRGAEVVFISRERAGDACGYIEQQGFPVHRLPAASDPLSEPGHRWLGVSPEEDARQVRTVLAALGRVDWLIVDHYGLDARWESQMRTHAARILVIDDVADRPHDCDLLLDQNLYPDAHTRYRQLVPPACRQLLGPSYALLRPEFRRMREELGVRELDRGHLLISFGGSDARNATGAALAAVDLLTPPPNAVDTVCGGANLHRDTIRQRCEQRSFLHYHEQAENMAELMLRAGLAIGGGGSTTWERCCLGLPAAVITLADNQRPLTEAIAEAGAVFHIGNFQDLNPAKIAEAVGGLLADPRRLHGMSQAGMSLVDGRGAVRVADQLLAHA